MNPTHPAQALGLVLTGIFGLLAVGFLGGALWTTADRLDALLRFRSAPGEVRSVRIDGSPQARFVVHRIEVRYRPCPEPPPPPPNPYPFTLPDTPDFRLLSEPYGECIPGERRPRQSTVMANGPTTLAVGDPVRVLWHPDQPRRVYVTAFSTFWSTPFLLTMLGAPFAWYGSRMWREERQRWRDTPTSPR